MKKLVFLETWKINWGSAKATNHRGTFTSVTMSSSLLVDCNFVSIPCSTLLFAALDTVDENLCRYGLRRQSVEGIHHHLVIKTEG